ncbi:unnamed protein product [Amoebophrya sp. A25]|nr:unnamed protein product [Amoebophrya sp. A25]|eukprot:GSA25T00015970001.1
MPRTKADVGAYKALQKAEQKERANERALQRMQARGRAAGSNKVKASAKAINKLLASAASTFEKNERAKARNQGNERLMRELMDTASGGTNNLGRKVAAERAAAAANRIPRPNRRNAAKGSGKGDPGTGQSGSSSSRAPPSEYDDEL